MPARTRTEAPDEAAAGTTGPATNTSTREQTTKPKEGRVHDDKKPHRKIGKKGGVDR